MSSIIDKTRERIAIMQAYVEGGEIEVQGSGGWLPTAFPCWDWLNYNYRVKPELIVRWVNVYPDGGIYLHPTEEDAKLFAGDKARTIKLVEDR